MCTKHLHTHTHTQPLTTSCAVAIRDHHRQTTTTPTMTSPAATTTTAPPTDRLLNFSTGALITNIDTSHTDSDLWRGDHRGDKAMLLPLSHVRLLTKEEMEFVLDLVRLILYTKPLNCHFLADTTDMYEESSLVFFNQSWHYYAAINILFFSVKLLCMSGDLVCTRHVVCVSTF